MKTIFCTSAIIFTLALESAALGQSPAPDAPDLLRGVIDPYFPIAERARFGRTAGVDSEIEESEFKPSADGFVRVFDHWASAKHFDGDGNGRLGWFEADAYRKALSRAVIANYDADKSRKLEGDERIAASRDLAAGKAPPVSRELAAAPPRGTRPGNPNPLFNFGQPGQPGQLPPQLMAMLDTDGDGQLSKDERIAGIRNLRDRGREWVLGQLDKDGDGKLSASELAAAPSPIRIAVKIDQLGLRDFDEDGDGKLSDGEYSALDDYLQKWLKANEEAMIRFADLDGDGQISSEEQAALQAKAQGAMFQMLPRLLGWADSDGDGQANPQEWLGLVDRFEEGFDRQMDKYTRQFDADGNGRLNASERDALIAGLMAEDRERQRRHDRDGDGQLNVNELVSLLDEAAEEWNLRPAR